MVPLILPLPIGGSTTIERTLLLTLLRLPNPILCKAADFHSGNGGWNWTLFKPLPRRHSFKTPNGRVHKTASPFRVWELVLFLALLTVISTPVKQCTKIHYNK